MLAALVIASAALVAFIHIEAGNEIDGLFRAPRRAPGLPTAVPSLIFLWATLISFWRVRPPENLTVSGFIAAFFVAACLAVEHLTGWWISPIPFLITAAVAVPYCGWRRLHLASLSVAERLTSIQRQTGYAISHPERLDVAYNQPLALDDVHQHILDARRFCTDLLASIAEPVLILDPGGMIVAVNPSARDFGNRFELSLGPGTAIDQVLQNLSPIDGDPAVSWPPREATPPGYASLSQLARIDPDGRTWEFRFIATRDTRDAPTGWIVHMTEIKVGIAAIQGRETAMRQREEALQLLSHDMRSPQAAILSILASEEFRNAPPGLRSRIEHQARRTLNLAESFVRMVHAESDEYVLEPLDVGHLLEDAADSVWELSQATRVKVRFEPWRGEFVVLGDRNLLTRVLVNLLDNALKFSPAGKTVICRLTRTRLDGRSAVACAIADSAGGMSEDELAGLFGKYSNVRVSHGGSRGVGLGLALVQAVVTRHGGTVTCESAVGVGSVFTVTLPSA